MRRPFLLATLLFLLAAGTAYAETFDDLRTRFRKEQGEAYAVRILTVQAMAALDTEEAARFLLAVVEKDDDQSMRLNTIHQVARMSHRLVFDELLRIFLDGDESLRSTAFHGITYNREELLPEPVLAKVLAGSDQNLRSNAIRYLAKRGDERFAKEAERFLAQFPNGATSLTSILIQAATPEAARILIRIYDDTRKYERDQAPKVFAEDAPEVRAVLVEALGSPSRAVRVNAALLAARAAVAEAEEALVRAIHPKDEELHAIVVEALGAVGAPSELGRRAILTALEAEAAGVRAAAVRAVRRTPLKEAIPLLIQRLADAERVVSVEAAVTLERVTGQQYGDRADLWQKWWEEYGDSLDTEAVKPQENQGLSQVLVDLAIERGAAALKARRGDDPPWVYANHPTGTTALVLLALHAAGCDRKDKDVKAAVRYLLKAPVPEHTYDIGLVAMALEAVGGKRHKRRITACARRLLATQLPAGLWGYPTGDGDNSNTQYAVLGLRAAARVGVKIPQKAWRGVRDHFYDARGNDGGWTYPIKRPEYSSTSMTGSGVCCLLICLENMKLSADERTELEAVIDKGYEALGNLMKPDKDTLYALYGVERAGVLGVRTTMAGKPWYAPGAQRLVDEQGRDGLWTGSYDPVVETAFAILFLKRATTPIAALAPTTR